MNLPTPFIFDCSTEYTTEEFFNALQNVTRHGDGLVFHMKIDDTKQDIFFKRWEIMLPDMADVVLREETGKGFPVRVLHKWYEFLSCVELVGMGAE